MIPSMPTMSTNQREKLNKFRSDLSKTMSIRDPWLHLELQTNSEAL